LDFIRLLFAAEPQLGCTIGGTFPARPSSTGFDPPDALAMPPAPAGAPGATDGEDNAAVLPASKAGRIEAEEG
jgi:hypothetical protein